MTKPALLFVDDNQHDQTLIRLALDAVHSDSHLEFLWSGDEALSYLLRQGNYTKAPRPDLVTLDLNLPKVKGSEVFRQMRQNPDLKEIPVVFFSGAKPSADMAAECTDGPNFYIVKPHEIDLFFTVIQTIEEYARAKHESPEKKSVHEERLRQLSFGKS